MRHLRLLLATASAVLLVGVSTGTVLSQDEDQYLTGTLTFSEDIDPGTYTELEGRDEVRGASAAYNLRMSDPRVSGVLTTADIALDGYTGERIAFDGTAELVSEEGAWAGNWTGVFEPMMGWQILSKLEGQGVLEGLTAYLHGASPEIGDGVWEMEGFVVGEPPAE